MADKNPGTIDAYFWGVSNAGLGSLVTLSVCWENIFCACIQDCQRSCNNNKGNNNNNNNNNNNKYKQN